ncbi:MAG: phoU [Verrucomicrobiaceae bacterium]|nr:phoU [Verrucomicrobiaceae bacterium]
MTPPHIVKAFDQELQTLTSSIGAMGDFAGAQFSDSVQALLRGDLVLAQRVIDQDRQLDALRRDLSAAAASVIARRQPMATDLDEVLSDFRIVEELERIGDLAKNIAKRATAVSSANFPLEIVEMLERLSALAAALLKGALETYVTRDAEQAIVVRQQDEEIDELHTSIFRDIVSRMTADQSQVIDFVHLLFCAKNIERIGDHATHIAEAAYFTVTGQRPPLERRRLDQSSLTKSADTVFNVE